MFFTNLPRDLIQQIYSFLAPKDLARQERICKQLRGIAAHDDVWKYTLHQIAGSHYQKKVTDPRSNKSIYIETIQHLPKVAHEFLLVIGAEKEKIENDGEDEEEDYVGDDSLDSMVELIQKFSHMTSLYSVVNYLLMQKEHYPAIAKDDDLTSSGLPYKLAHIAAAFDDSDTLELLKNYKKNLDIKDISFDTPLHVAAEFNSFAAASTLKSFNSNLMENNGNGMMPMEVAAFHLNYCLLDLLYVDKRSVKDWYGKSFSDFFIRCVVQEQDTFERVSTQKIDLRKIYLTKHKILQQDSKDTDKALKSTLSETEFSVMKCIDFFIDKGWSVPDWFDTMMTEIEWDVGTSDKMAKLF